MSRKPFEPAKTKYSPTSNASNRKRAYTAIGLTMLLTFVSVMVYMISSLDEDAILSQDEVDVELNEWHTYYVESESDLPECADFQYSVWSNTRWTDGSYYNANPT